MPFERIRLCGDMTKEPNDAERPYTVGLTAHPSDTWIAVFDEDWHSIVGPPPKVVDDRIALSLPTQESPEELFTRIALAVERANDAEEGH